MKIRTLIVLLVAVLAALGSGCSTSVTSEDWRRGRRPLRTDPHPHTAEILVGFAQLVALVGDGHTSFYAGNQDRQWFRFYPISLYSFSDGIYLTTATEEHAHLFGKRLVRIDDTPIEEAFRAISTTVGADNDMEYRYTVPFDLIRPELLYVLGIAKSPDRAELGFEDGTRETLLPLTKKA